MSRFARRPHVRALVGGAVSGLLVVACQVDLEVGRMDPSPGDSGVDALARSDGFVSTSEAGPDAKADAKPDATYVSGCGTSLPRSSRTVSVLVVDEVRPFGSPDQSIGTGTYELVALRSYLNGPRGTLDVRSTLEVKGSPSVGTFAFTWEASGASGDFKNEALEVRSYTYNAHITGAMDAQRTCPQTLTPESWNFVARANGHLFLSLEYKPLFGSYIEADYQRISAP